MRRTLRSSLLVAVLVLAICFPSFAAGSNTNIGETAFYFAQKTEDEEVRLEALRVALMAFMSEEPERSWDIWDKTLREGLIKAIYSGLDEKERRIYKQFESPARELIDQLLAAILLGGTQYPDRIKHLAKLLPRDPDRYENRLHQLLEQKLKDAFGALEKEEDPEETMGALVTLFEMFVGSAWLNLEPQIAKSFLLQSVTNLKALGESLAEYAMMTPINCLARVYQWQDLSDFCSQRMKEILAGLPEEEREDLGVIQELAEYSAELFRLGAASIVCVTKVEGLMAGSQHVMAKLEKKPENVEAVLQFSEEMLKMAASTKPAHKTAALMGVTLLATYEMNEEAKQVIETVIETSDETAREEVMPGIIALAQHIDHQLFLRLLKEYIQLKLTQVGLFFNPREAVRALLFVVASSADPQKPLERETVRWVEAQIEKNVELGGDKAVLWELLARLADEAESARLNQKVENISRDIIQTSEEAGLFAGVLLVQIAPFDPPRARQLIDVFVEKTKGWPEEKRLDTALQILETLEESSAGPTGASSVLMGM